MQTIKLVVRTGFMARFSSSIWKLKFFPHIKNLPFTLNTISPFWLMVIKYVAWGDYKPPLLNANRYVSCATLLMVSHLGNVAILPI